jgi:hypothetical protein
LKLFTNDILGWILLFVPIGIFIFEFFTVAECSTGCERTVLRGEIISFGFIVIAFLLNLVAPLSADQKSQFISILLVSLLLLMFSVVDLWVGPQKRTLVLHIRTVLQTMALFLLAYSLYTFYVRGYYANPTTASKATSVGMLDTMTRACEEFNTSQTRTNNILAATAPIILT